MDIDLFNELNSGSENEYMDRKAAWHNNKVKLLHDIICLCNSYTESTRYLLFGVNNSGDKIGILDDQNRKNSAHIQDMLRQSGFNRIPDVNLYTLQEMGLEFDVVEIFNRPDKPFYLTRDKTYQGITIRAGVIYSRIKDTNIPLGETAPEDKIELMWRERFGIGKPPLERLKNLLNFPDDWITPKEGEMYHRVFPEFSIKDGDILHDPFHEKWTDTFLDRSAYSKYINVYYFGTLIKSMGFVICDGGRYKIPLPRIPHIDQQGSYFIYRDSIEYKFANVTNRIFRNRGESLYSLLIHAGISVL